MLFPVARRCSLVVVAVIWDTSFELSVAENVDVVTGITITLTLYPYVTTLSSLRYICTVDRLEECITEVGQWMSASLLKLNAHKTELLWAGSKHGLAYFSSNRPSLRLGANTVTASEHVRLLGVMMSSDLSLEKHVDTVCSKCFFWLRQLKIVRRSLDAESMKTLVHAFVTPRVNYGNNPCWCTKERH